MATNDPHFFIGKGMECDHCGEFRFDPVHPKGETDLPVERTFTLLETALLKQTYDSLAAEHLLPFDVYGIPMDREEFTRAARPTLHQFLQQLMAGLETCDGPLHAYHNVLMARLVPDSGFSKHGFLNEEGGLLCETCGMVSEHELHGLILTI